MGESITVCGLYAALLRDRFPIAKFGPCEVLGGSEIEFFSTPLGIIMRLCGSPDEVILPGSRTLRRRGGRNIFCRDEAVRTGGATVCFVGGILPEDVIGGRLFVRLGERSEVICENSEKALAHCGI